jgi:chemotaxis regulatin CheY-phosphate phosphatase CheZ
MQTMPMNNVVEVLFGIIPVLDKIKQSIEKSTGAIPRVSTQLSNVTQATEMATVEILNVLDRMTGRIETAETAVSTLKRGNGNLGESLEAIGKALEDTRQDSMNIAMALQVQDITSQQIAGVSEMIEAVRRQLLEALGHLAPGEEIPEGDTVAPKKVFDGNASYTGSGERQENADEIVKQFKKVDNE